MKIKIYIENIFRDLEIIKNFFFTSIRRQNKLLKSNMHGMAW